MWCKWKCSQGEVGQILNDFGGEGEGPQGLGLWVGLRQAKERRAEDSRTEKTKEERSGDEPLADLWLSLVFAKLPPAGEDLV